MKRRPPGARAIRQARLRPNAREGSLHERCVCGRLGGVSAPCSIMARAPLEPWSWMHMVLCSNICGLLRTRSAFSGLRSGAAFGCGEPRSLPMGDPSCVAGLCLVGDGACSGSGDSTRRRGCLNWAGRIRGRQHSRGVGSLLKSSKSFDSRCAARSTSIGVVWCQTFGIGYDEERPAGWPRGATVHATLSVHNSKRMHGRF